MNKEKEEILWCDRQNGSKGKECKCICHQEDYPLPKDFPQQTSVSFEELKKQAELVGLKEWSKQGRTKDQIWAVNNFLTGIGGIKIRELLSPKTQTSVPPKKS